ncbi:MAG: response regulator [Candidatus Tectomicrobia bacterium]|uniref:Response regulator n=1 Tax=Tectimicrobiota bacterium TaxID=2528274 RepID=A0A932FXM3_UNCTE|nr:response regulator [Candidatus Tectomicrobia bacterium]
MEKEPCVSKGKVLFMDDQEIARSLMERILKRFGYEISLAKDGAEAIDLYKNAKESGMPFDVVIMDLTIPGGMGGEEVIQKLLEIDPKVKAIAMSGYSNDPIIVNCKKYGFSGSVAKPYGIEQLNKVLQDIMTETSH